MVGAKGHGFSYVEHAELLGLSSRRVVVLVAGFFAPGGPTGAGLTLQTAYKLSSGMTGEQTGIILMLISLILFIIGFTMGGLNYVVTVLQGRTRGMTPLMRMPLTIWGIFDGHRQRRCSGLSARCLSPRS